MSRSRKKMQQMKNNVVRNNGQAVWKQALACGLTAAVLWSAYGVAQAAAIDPIQQGGQTIGQSLKNTEERNEYLNREMQDRENAAHNQGAVIQQEPAAQTIDKDTGEKINVTRIEFSSSEIFTAEELKNVAADYEGRAVSLSELQAMVNKVNKLYRDKNFISAKAVLPPQKITNGIVNIKLIEGHYARVLVDGNHIMRDDAYALHLKKGELVELNALQQELVYFNRTHAAQIKGELLPGEKLGETDLKLHAIEPNRWRATLYTDNAGSESSGIYRIGGIFVNNSLFGGGEMLILNPTWSKGTLAGSVSYSQPLNNNGLRLTASYGRNNVDIIHGKLASMDVEGNSNDVSLGLSQTFQATRELKSDLSLEYHHKHSETSFAGVTLLDNEANTCTANYTILQNLHFGAVYGSIGGTYIKASQRGSYDNKDFSRYNAEVIRQMMFKGGQTLTMRGTAQLSPDKEMPSTEQFSLGGISTVKGFQEGLLVGDSGYYCGVEYSVPVYKQENGRILFSVDHGATEQRFLNGLKEHNYLTSASLGYSQNIGKNAFAKLYFSFPLNYSDAVNDPSRMRVNFYTQVNF